ncbi:hypothetical protein [Geoalkalibacter sp.]|nr:hypothetical protein [Geoalkalibacter sp.]
MLTATEITLNLCIWGLLGVGLFFGLRAALRRRRQARRATDQSRP